MAVRPNSIIAKENRKMADQIEIPSHSPIQARLAGLISSDLYWLCPLAQHKNVEKQRCYDCFCQKAVAPRAI